MGQKINPLSFRLGKTQIHNSFWFCKPKYFSFNLKEDEEIRNSIKDYVQKVNQNISSFEGIFNIIIQKRRIFIKVIIYIGFPNSLIEWKKQDINKLRVYVKRELININQKLFISIKIIEKPYNKSIIIAEYIALQLKNRVSFRKAMKKIVELTENTGTKGIQVQVAGRVDGKDISRVEWIREGKVPLQTIKAKIDFFSHKVKTIYGMLGIKIWIFQ